MSQMCEEKKRNQCMSLFLRWDCKWPLSTERNTFIRRRDLTHCCPLQSVSHTGRPTVSHTTVNAAGQAGSLARHRSTVHPQRSSLSSSSSSLRPVCLFQVRLLSLVPFKEAQPGRREVSFRLGRREDQGTARLIQGAVRLDYVVCTI